MSNFTTEVRWLLETNYNFDMTHYPIFDENYRTTLNNKILQHYKFYEIGFETAGLWKDRLNCKLNEIMPYYNQLYKSALLTFNPLYNVDYKESFNRNATGTTTGNSASNSTNSASGEANTKNLYQETPQGTIVQTGIDDQTHATNMTLEKNNNTSTANISDTTNSTSNISNLEDYEKVVQGNSGSVSNSELILQFRKTFLNIDMQIINDLNELFMGLWDY